MTVENAKKLLGIREDQIWLLKAALFAPEEAITYWVQWKKYWQLDNVTKEKAKFDVFARVDAESQRVLPLAYRNLEHTQDPLLPALKEAYRTTWMRNQKLLQRAQQIVKVCNEAGVPNMLLKGIPLALYYYKDMGVRPMSDIDLLVPWEHLEQTSKLLEKLGNKANPIERKYQHLIHAIHCFDEGGVDVDLHWKAFFFQSNRDNNYLFTNNYSEELQLTSADSTLILNASYQLFHTIIHGTLGGQRTIRWLADAVKICQSSSFKRDLISIEDYAAKNHLDYTLRVCLLFIKEEFKLPISLPTTDYSTIENLNQQKLFFQLSQKNTQNNLLLSLKKLIRQAIAYDLFYKEKSKKTKFAWLWERLRFRIEHNNTL